MKINNLECKLQYLKEVLYSYLISMDCLNLNMGDLPMVVILNPASAG